MDNKTKFFILVGPALMDFVYSATQPIIQIYFMRLINSEVLALANILTTGLAAAVNASITSDKIKDFYRQNFFWIIVIDVICFFLINFESLTYPEVRYLGFAVLNAVSTTIWYMIIEDAVNHKISGDKLTKWDSFSRSAYLVASLLGGIVAIICTFDIEYCIVAQCIANFIMGCTDWKVYKDIKY